MASKGSNDRAAKIAKAGKRSGSAVYPATISAEKRAGQEAGDQQFISKTQQYVEQEKIVFDKNKMRFVTKRVQVPVDFTYDESRRHWVMSPVLKTAVVRSNNRPVSK